MCKLYQSKNLYQNIRQLPGKISTPTFPKTQEKKVSISRYSTVNLQSSLDSPYQH